MRLKYGVEWFHRVQSMKLSNLISCICVPPPQCLPQKLMPLCKACASCPSSTTNCMLSRPACMTTMDLRTPWSCRKCIHLVDEFLPAHSTQSEFSKLWTIYITCFIFLVPCKKKKVSLSQIAHCFPFVLLDYLLRKNKHTLFIVKLFSQRYTLGFCHIFLRDGK